MQFQPNKGLKLRSLVSSDLNYQVAMDSHDASCKPNEPARVDLQLSDAMRYPSTMNERQIDRGCDQLYADTCAINQESYCSNPSQCNCHYDQGGVLDAQRAMPSISSTLSDYSNYFNRQWNPTAIASSQENREKSPSNRTYPVSNYATYQELYSNQCGAPIDPYETIPALSARRAELTMDVRMVKAQDVGRSKGNQIVVSHEIATADANSFEAEPKSHPASGATYPDAQLRDSGNYSSRATTVEQHSHHQRRESRLTLIGDNNSNSVAVNSGHAYTVSEQMAASYMGHPQISTKSTSQHDTRIADRTVSSQSSSSLPSGRLSSGRFSGAGIYCSQSSRQQSSAEHQVGGFNGATFDNQAPRKQLNSNSKFNSRETGAEHLQDHSSSFSHIKFAPSLPLSQEQQDSVTYAYANQSGSQNNDANFTATDPSLAWAKHSSLVSSTSAASSLPSSYGGHQLAQACPATLDQRELKQQPQQQSISMAHHDQQPSMESDRMDTGVNGTFNRQEHRLTCGGGQLYQQSADGPGHYFNLRHSLNLSLSNGYSDQHPQTSMSYHQQASQVGSSGTHAGSTTPAQFSIIY